MEAVLSPSANVAATTTATTFKATSRLSIKLPKTPFRACHLLPITTKLESKKITYSSAISSASNTHYLLVLSSSSFSSSYSSISTLSSSTRTSAASTTYTPSIFATSSSTTIVNNRYWIVIMERPPQGINSKAEIIDYYVNILQGVLGSEKDAQMCIYDASWDTCFGFCCDIDEETSNELARLPGVLSVRPDPDFTSAEKDYKNLEVQSGPLSNTSSGCNLLFPARNSKNWLVRIENPGIGVVTKAQMVDYYTQLLTKVMGNEKDAQMCIYQIWWQSNFGFCCELDEECARELAGVRGVLSVQPEENFGSDNKNYAGGILQQIGDSPKSSLATETTNVKTKKLFVTGLSFYTSEKTLRAAFEGFGELVEVKIIMDKISKRSKGYAFIEFTTEEAGGAALREMNGKIINGWMITVDVAKSNPPKYSKGRPRPGR